MSLVNRKRCYYDANRKDQNWWVENGLVSNYGAIQRLKRKSFEKTFKK